MAQRKKAPGAAAKSKSAAPVKTAAKAKAAAPAKADAPAKVAVKAKKAAPAEAAPAKGPKAKAAPAAAAKAEASAAKGAKAKAASAKASKAKGAPVKASKAKAAKAEAPAAKAGSAKASKAKAEPAKAAKADASSAKAKASKVPASKAKAAKADASSAKAAPAKAKASKAKTSAAKGDAGGNGVKPARATTVFKDAKDVRVLVVDDEPEVLELLVPFLKKQGYTVSEAQDGDHALEKILTDRPNIVVLDVMMPGLSGWEISRYVRERRELDPVRIIMATGIGRDTNAATSPLYGADEYIDKPFRLDTLNKKVKDVIARIEAGRY